MAGHRNLCEDVAGIPHVVFAGLIGVGGLRSTPLVRRVSTHSSAGRGPARCTVGIVGGRPCGGTQCVGVVWISRMSGDHHAVASGEHLRNVVVRFVRVTEFTLFLRETGSHSAVWGVGME